MSCLPGDSNSPVALLSERSQYLRVLPPGLDPNPVLPAKPLWKSPEQWSLGMLAAALRQSDLYLLADHSQVTRFADEHQTLIREEVSPQDGYHSELLCFTPDLPTSQDIFLKFEAGDGCPPVTGVSPTPLLSRPLSHPAWMLFANGSLWLGLEGWHMGYRSGVWSIPLADIDPLIAQRRAAQKTNQDRLRAEAAAAEEQRRKESEQRQARVLAKYDLNHNGVIDLEEREDALDVPDFIEFTLEEIDANHNGWLDPAELAWFDANHNRALEQKELAGIGICEHLLAARFLKEFDANGDGKLDSYEFADLMNATADPVSRNSWNILLGIRNLAGAVDLQNLENALALLIRQGFRPPFAAMRAAPFQPGAAGRSPWTPSKYSRPPWITNGRIQGGAPTASNPLGRRYLTERRRPMDSQMADFLEPSDICVAHGHLWGAWQRRRGRPDRLKAGL